MWVHEGADGAHAEGDGGLAPRARQGVSKACQLACAVAFGGRAEARRCSWSAMRSCCRQTRVVAVEGEEQWLWSRALRAWRGLARGVEHP